MAVFVGFMRGMWAQAPLVRAWVGWIVVVLCVVPLVFLEHRVAAGMLAAFFAGALMMVGLYARYGFTRVLGLAHVWWLPAVVAIMGELQSGQAHGVYASWLAVALGTAIISLVLDVRDVWMWFTDDAEPVTTV